MRTIGFESRRVHELEIAIDKETKHIEAKINIPFTSFSENLSQAVLVDGVITGLHHDTGEVLVSWTRGGKAKLTDSYVAEYLIPLEEWERVELKSLVTQIALLQKRKEQILDAHRIRDFLKLITETLDIAK